MARLRKNETSVNIAPAAASAAPARRKTAAPQRKRAAAKPAAGSSQPEPNDSVAIVASFSEPAAALSAEPAVTTVSQTATIEYLPSREDIAALAYSYWVNRGYTEGCPEQDWLRAEGELRRRALATA